MPISPPINSVTEKKTTKCSGDSQRGYVDVGVRCAAPSSGKQVGDGKGGDQVVSEMTSRSKPRQRPISMDKAMTITMK